MTRAARLPARVSALTLNSCPSFDALTQAITGTKPALQSSVSNSGAAAVLTGVPTIPRSTESPLVALCNAAFFTGATPASAPVNPIARPPAALMAATNRVLMDPASTETTISSVSGSVTRRPSTWRLGMPTCASDASISRPPPCTTISGRSFAACLITLPIAASRSALSISSPPSFRTTGRFTASLPSGQSRTSR